MPSTMLTERAITATVPHRPLQQKEQKNFRLTRVAITMLQKLGITMGLSESAVIERLAREEFERRRLTLSPDKD